MGTSRQPPLQCPQCALPERPMAAALGPPRPCRASLRSGLRHLFHPGLSPSVGPSSLLCVSAGASQARGGSGLAVQPAAVPLAGYPGSVYPATAVHPLSRGPAPNVSHFPREHRGPETASELEGTETGQGKASCRTGKPRFWRAGAPLLCAQTSAVGSLDRAWCWGRPRRESLVLLPVGALCAGPHSL